MFPDTSPVICFKEKFERDKEQALLCSTKNSKISGPLCTHVTEEALKKKEVKKFLYVLSMFRMGVQ